MIRNMEFEHICYKIIDTVAYITLNQPKKRNPLSHAVKLELCDAFDACNADSSIRAVVIRGAGGHFSAGGDADEKKTALEKNEQIAREACRLGAETNLKLRRIQKPTIACVDGSIAGSGLTLALACDFQVVSETAKCTFAFVNLAIIPDCGATCIATRALGTTRASDLLLSGRRFSGQEGADWGLFTEAVPADQLGERVQQYIDKYRNGPTVAYACIKELINQVQYADYIRFTPLETEYLERCELTKDYKAAVNAFLAKKPPQFYGR